MKLNTFFYMHFFAFSLLFVPFIGAISPTNAKENPKIDAHGNIIDSGEQSPTSQTARPAQRPVQEYNDPIQFMNDFLNIDVKPKKSLRYWALQLVLLLKNDPNLRNFCNEIQAIARNKEPYQECAHNLELRKKSINDAFKKAWINNYFSPELSRFIFKDLERVKIAIQKRAAVVTEEKE